MFKKLVLVGSALAMGASTLVAAAPADAQRYRGGYYDRGYNDRGYAYDEAYRDGYNHRPRYYRGDRGRYRGRGCDNTGGTIVGAIAGGLLGRTIDRRGDRTLGTVLGAGAGALAGNAIDRSDNPSYCR
ncbi:Glycine zipper 2TM domain-containing protein [Sphingomonas gellani]|uniref:17 kDa surface antigen n=1 Tax=Sphingomonas gellani TaxID=1166340 RepID=A0A1H8GK10_9SPHN|nr:glycine zipper 2TM domain-containing protein [Sphingomonas gellani]SEN44303.1 Glycine zipper 2TM domain-containing protein [Sphingomonas gellani]